MSLELERYLNDHLAGSAGALLLISHLADTADLPGAPEFFTSLHGQVEADQKLLERLLDLAGMSPSGTSKAAGQLTARVGMLKLMWEGFKPGELGMFEALEMLAIGIQGKRLLWVALSEVTPWFHEWESIDFAALELDAIGQRDQVEAWRVEAARDILPGAERRDASVARSSPP